ncbi:P-loop containing nucleoside triphosphate hydrolase protein [Cristinia sonorae]|uniref:P-loop containing nucleoside triphosphate hydrolase protein n=1 Tax=Cristinia sonorae TaxID=1940300 RepID=A0A8K0UI44_9AGAR|nr:P-loop containing nucleoside triphosphate hydrolase protein [Cristinia sonorae]
MNPPGNSVLIGVMGATGAGKSTFVNLASGSSLRIGYGLESCTSEVEVSPPLAIDGKNVTLIDTPGFDDTNKSEAEILTLIADFLATTYENGRKLHGVIFIHRISDHRMGGVARKNFRLFRKLCGDDAMRNVVIVTNMWGEVTEDIGASRERELAGNELFFKNALEKGAEMIRHDNTSKSAHRIIKRFLNGAPEVLSIQREVVDERKPVAETAAGKDLHADLEEQITKHRQEIQEVRSELEALMAQKDQAHQEEIEELSVALGDLKSQLTKAQEANRVLHEETRADRVEVEKAKRMAQELQVAEREEELRRVEEQRRQQLKSAEQLSLLRGALAKSEKAVPAQAPQAISSREDRSPSSSGRSNPEPGPEVVSRNNPSKATAKVASATVTPPPRQSFAPPPPRVERRSGWSCVIC